MHFGKPLLALALAATSVESFALVSRRSVALASPMLLAQSSRVPTRMMSTTTPMEFAKTEIEKSKVVVFSKSYCPFCTATKGLLDDLDIEYTLFELDQMDNGADIQAALLDISGQRTVPNVFVKGQHLGGNDKTQAAARTGKLQEMLKD